MPPEPHTPSPPRDRSRLWRCGLMDEVLLFRAHFTEFVFQRHIHREYAVGVIEHGAQRFHLGGATHVAPRNAMITVNPGQVHDGEAATRRGYRYRMAYLPEALVAELLGRSGALPRFAAPVTQDPALAAVLHHALMEMERPAESRLAAQGGFVAAVTALFSRHARPCGPGAGGRGDDARIRRAADFIQAHCADDPGLAAIADAAGLSRFYFLRTFKRAIGLSPHAYLAQCRLHRVRDAIRAGRSLAQAAAGAGFADQSHMTRSFKAAYGLTPGQFQRAVAG